jgi:hypothetical protein
MVVVVEFVDDKRDDQRGKYYPIRQLSSNSSRKYQHYATIIIFTIIFTSHTHYP